MRYTAPQNVRIMERDLAELAHILPQNEIAYTPQAPVWGWDRSFVTWLREHNYSGLPSDEQLQVIRQLSSRQTSVKLLKQLKLDLPEESFIGSSAFVTDVMQLDDYINQNNTNKGEFQYILKEPLSGSGRGLRFVKGELTSHQRNWAQRCIREQDGVVIEPYYNKVIDFALEFTISEDTATLAGLSLFTTNENNVYSGNIIAPQNTLWERLYHYVPAYLFETLILRILPLITQTFVGNYLGPIGIDMMIVAHEGEYKIHPCVEINVRRTMGELALHLPAMLAPGVTGLFSLQYHKTTPIAPPPQPKFNKEGLLLEGTKLLTTIHPDTHYVAVLETIDIDKYLAKET